MCSDASQDALIWNRRLFVIASAGDLSAHATWSVALTIFYTLHTQPPNLINDNAIRRTAQSWAIPRCPVCHRSFLRNSLDPCIPATEPLTPWLVSGSHSIPCLGPGNLCLLLRLGQRYYQSSTIPSGDRTHISSSHIPTPVSHYTPPSAAFRITQIQTRSIQSPRGDHADIYS